MNTMIAYFSYTGHTKGIVWQIRELSGGYQVRIELAEQE